MLKPAERIALVCGADAVDGSWSDYLRQLPDFVVFFCSSRGEDLLSYCERLAPCVLMVGVDGFRSLDRMQLREGAGSAGPVQTIIVSNDAKPSVCEEYLSGGCSGILERDASLATVQRAIRAVAAGEIWMPRKILSEAYRQLACLNNKKNLTRRESVIFELMASGKNNREIAEALFISRETVRWHVRGIYSKIGMRDRKGVASAYMVNRGTEATRTYPTKKA
jgi:DNA-binding NarL/FixJ family response regulator